MAVSSMVSPTWVPALPASPEPYRVFLRDHGWELALEPQRVQFKGFEDWDTFSHKVERGYRVSERLTGLAIVSGSGGAATFLSRGEALGAAAARLGEVGAHGFTNSVLSILRYRQGTVGA